jgi:ribosomal-protein-alanine N-acetyltransferase
MLRTKRLILRRAQPNDLMDLFTIYSDPRAMRYWSTPPHDSPDRTQENLDRMCAAPDPLVYFVIEMGGHAIGTAGMHFKNEVGFLLHPDYWRQGIVQEAMQAIIPHIWDVTDVAEVSADADPRNKASCHLLKSLGFTHSHSAKDTYCINDVWSDSDYFVLKRPKQP